MWTLFFPTPNLPSHSKSRVLRSWTRCDVYAHLHIHIHTQCCREVCIHLGIVAGHTGWLGCIGCIGCHFFFGDFPQGSSVISCSQLCTYLGIVAEPSHDGEMALWSPMHIWKYALSHTWKAAVHFGHRSRVEENAGDLWSHVHIYTHALWKRGRVYAGIVAEQKRSEANCEVTSIYLPHTMEKEACMQVQYWKESWTYLVVLAAHSGEMRLSHQQHLYIHTRAHTYTLWKKRP